MSPFTFHLPRYQRDPGAKNPLRVPLEGKVWYNERMNTFWDTRSDSVVLDQLVEILQGLYPWDLEEGDDSHRGVSFVGMVRLDPLDWGGDVNPVGLFIGTKKGPVEGWLRIKVEMKDSDWTEASPEFLYRLGPIGASFRRHLSADSRALNSGGNAFCGQAPSRLVCVCSGTGGRL